MSRINVMQPWLGAEEAAAVSAVIELARCERARVLFYDDESGALWSELDDDGDALSLQDPDALQHLLGLGQLQHHDVGTVRHTVPGAGDAHAWRRASSRRSSASSTSTPRPGPCGTATWLATTSTCSAVICWRYFSGPIR